MLVSLQDAKRKAWPERRKAPSRIPFPAEKVTEAFDCLRSALTVFDSDDRLIYANEHFRYVYFCIDELEPLIGQTFESLLRRIAASGEIADAAAADDTDRWVRTRLIEHRTQRPQVFEQQLADGRCLQIKQRPTPEGGSVLLWIDITETMRERMRLEDEIRGDVTALRKTETELRQRGAALEQTIKELQTAQERLKLQSALLAAANDELETARTDAEQANTYKTSFLRSITHELRTPLNAITGFSEFLATEPLGPVGHPKYVEYIGYIRSSSQHLLSLINQLLDLSRVEAGKMELRREPHDAIEIVEYCAAMLRENADRGAVTLALALPAEPVAVDVDILAARQVMLNLLSNAIKFTPREGSIQVRLDVEDEFAAITVADSGQGIAEEDLPRLMQPFMQAGDILTRRDQGSGLGLAIAKALTELHGGRIELASEIGKGTTVRVTFPLADLDERAA